MGNGERSPGESPWLPEDVGDELDDRALEEAIRNARRSTYAALRELDEVA